MAKQLKCVSCSVLLGVFDRRVEVYRPHITLQKDNAYCKACAKDFIDTVDDGKKPLTGLLFELVQAMREFLDKAE